MTNEQKQILKLALNDAGIFTVEDLLAASMDDIRESRTMGPIYLSLATEAKLKGPSYLRDLLA